MSSAPKRCNASKQRKKRGNAHIHFGFLHIFTAFHTFLTGNSHICKKKRNVSAKKCFGQNKKKGFACNAREFISIKSLQKNKKRRRKNAHPSWNFMHFYSFSHIIHRKFPHPFLQKKKPSARKHFSKKKLWQPKNGSARNAHKFFSNLATILPHKKNTKKGRKNAHPSWNFTCRTPHVHTPLKLLNFKKKL